MIVFENVTKRYKSNIGLDDVSVRINEGDFVFLVGPSGAGKSTFIKLILKELDADSGKIVVKNQEVTGLSARNVPKLRRNVGIVFQEFRLLPKKTVFENVAFAMEIVHKPKKLIKKHVPQVLTMMGIADKADKYPDELSAGEQQRVAIARAIARNPEIYIFDDSFSALDYKTDAVLRKELKKHTKDATNLIVAQRIGTIMNADKILVLDNGECVGIGTHKELLKSCEVYKQIALSQLSKEELENV